LVVVCAPAFRTVADATMPKTVTTASERRMEASIERLNGLLSYDT